MLAWLCYLSFYINEIETTLTISTHWRCRIIVSTNCWFKLKRPIKIVANCWVIAAPFSATRLNKFTRLHISHINISVCSRKSWKIWRTTNFSINNFILINGTTTHDAFFGIISSYFKCKAADWHIHCWNAKICHKIT